MLYACGMNLKHLNRRDFLRSSALGSLASIMDVQAIGQIYPFALGVASGSPTHDSVVLWTRIQGANQTLIAEAQVSVRWEMAHDEAFKQMVQKGKKTADALLGHSVHVEVQNLLPDRWYFYRFMVGNAISPVGRTRTFAKAGSTVNHLRLAYASCQRWEAGYFSAYKHMLADQPDVVLFLGDYIYEYPGNPATMVRKPSSTSTFGFVLTLDDYRALLRRRFPV